MRERRKIMNGWSLAMAGDSGLGHGVVAMGFWVWREESWMRERRKIYRKMKRNNERESLLEFLIKSMRETIKK